jgi:NCAIR mutase (PurE)-related protein
MPDPSGLLALFRSVVDGGASLSDGAVGGEGGAAPFAHVDHDREARCGFPEAIFAERKTPEETAEIAVRIFARSGRLLVTRATPAHAAAVLARLPQARHHERARVVTAEAREFPRAGRVAVVCAGTADLPVAEEAAATADLLGADVDRVYDVGVAGLHRVLEAVPRLRAANAVVVCAGMEGALPSVVGGLVAVPVYAVPTSVGYGASFGGLAALLGMLNSCAANVAVVNVDNGFGAGYQAALVNRLAVGARSRE